MAILALDGKTFPVKDGVPGLNMPPMHPWCRSTTIAVIDGAVTDGLKRRARNPETGELYEVPKNMTYEQWKKDLDSNYGSGYVDTRRKMVRNEKSDRKQYEKYISVLGKENMPKTFDLFQDLKYNNNDTWYKLKQWYRYEHKPYLQKQLNYVIVGGEKNFIPRGSIMRNVKTIAGNGCNTVLRDVKRLVYVYGGSSKEWKKRVGVVESNKYIFDVHWYELNGVQYEAKLKYRSDKI